MRSLRSRVGALLADARGLALTEFALVLPVLLILFLGGYQVADAIACKRKVTSSTRAIADLATRSSALTASEVDTILNAAAKVMTPYPSSPAFVRVSQVYTSDTGATTVRWSRAVGGTKLTKGSSVTLPGTLGEKDTYLVFSEITYAYDPRVSFGIVGPLSFGDSIFMSPRLSASVTCDDC